MNVKVFQLLLVFTDDINRLFEGYTLDSMFTKNVTVPTYYNDHLDQANPFLGNLKHH